MIIETCLSPLLIHQHDLENKVVVCIDILRATSTITSALHHGIAAVIPVETTEECLSFKGEEYIHAAERGGKNVEGFDFGNSPYDYMDESLKGKTLVLTTTNGTRILNLAKPAEHIVCGAFINLQALLKYIRSINKDVVCFCAGWQERPNLEDTLLAGAIAHELRESAEFGDDSTLLAENSWLAARKDLYRALRDSAHFKRLSHNKAEKDIRYCCSLDIIDSIPVLQANGLITSTTIG